MSLWSKGIERTKDIKKSDELVKKWSELLKTFPEVQKKWGEQDKVVLRMAGELSVAQYTANRDRILESKENLRQSIWKRDAPREQFQREIDKLNGEIESLNASIIFEKCEAWRKDLSLLRSKKSVQMIERRWTEKCYLIRFKSNLAVLDGAREKLSNALSELRGMRWANLGEILEFVKRIETELQRIDFTIMGEEQEVSEWKYQEISSQPGLTIFETGRMEPDKSGRLIVQKSGGPFTEPAFKEED